MLTDVQRKKLTHLFNVMDGDGNGRVEWADYQRIANNIASARGWKPGSAEHEAVIGKYRQGWEMAEPFAGEKGLALEKWLEYSDHIMSTPGAYDALVRPSAQIIFDTFDRDGDEKVSLAEWREFFKAYSIDPDEAEDCFEKYDVNGDGYVSRSELVDLVAQFYMSSDPKAPGNWLFGQFN